LDGGAGAKDSLRAAERDDLQWFASDWRLKTGDYFMTALDVCFRYDMPPGERELRALNAVREVYGIRRLGFDEKNRTVTVEYDATRLNDDSVASLLRGAGLDLKEKIKLV
jgi:hypothetical protein